MNEQAQWRELSDVLEGALGEGAAAESYLRSQGQLRRGRAGRMEAPRPREFDRNGFPVPQPARSFAQRVARLLSP
jgi:hypothetical protein